MATIRTIDFLPEIFQTTPNQQFLSSTLDVLVQQPNYDRVQGYIGSKFGYGVSSSDVYISEPNNIRNNYQLEPSIIFNKKGTSKLADLMTYPGVVDALRNNGADTSNHNLLFSNQFYSWDSFVDLDKFINYSQYYWLPEGPEPVTISPSTYYSTLDWKVNDDTLYYTFTNDQNTSEANPELLLVRGGTYTFEVNQTNPFWIQTMPGLSGTNPSKMNVSTREVLGVTNNGTNNGTITFTVPLATDQTSEVYTNALTVDLATTMSFDQLNGQPSANIAIDGVTYLNNKTVIFVESSPADVGNINEFFDMSGDAFDDSGFENTVPTQISKHYYTIHYITSNDGEYVISLTETGSLPDNQGILIRSGTEFIGRQFVKDSYDYISLVPEVTAPLSELYYQDGNSVDRAGKIKILDSGLGYIDINSILGQKNYNSPNGIQFTNGLKVQFEGSVVPTQYLNDLYYVEGVGTSIQLIPVSELVVPEKYSQDITTSYDDPAYGFDSLPFSETFYVPVTPDYLTINRASMSRNAWSRSNRWFHVDVLQTTIDNNISAPLASAALNSSTATAKRPILEFYPDLKLFNYGSVSLGNVTFIDFNLTDAINTVSGQLAYYPDGPASNVADGSLVVFANDSNINVRNKIYKVQIEPVDSTQSTTISFVRKLTNNQIKFSIPQQSVPPTVGRYYQVLGNNNTDYNGTYIVTDSSQNSITLMYPSDPGVFSTGTTTITVQPEIVLAPVAEVGYNEMVSVTDGATYRGMAFYFDGSNWYQTQQKTTVNQAPLFDLYDYFGNSLGNPEYYSGTDFAGCTLIEYQRGTGTNDPILGFPLSYTSVQNVGDIIYNISLNSNVFHYSANGVSTTAPVGTGYVYNYSTNTSFTRNIGWQTAADNSFQNQVFNLVYTGIPALPSFTLDVMMKDPSTTAWSTITVYIDNNRVDSTQYSVSTTSSTTTVTLTSVPAIGTEVVIMVYSDQVSQTGYYEIPSNLDSNPFNIAITSITLGDVRGHYKSICNNINSLQGNAFGPNNFRDLGNLVPYGTKIIQNSAPLLLPSAFIRNNNLNFFDATTFNAIEYETFKNKLVSSVDTLPVDLTQSVPAIFDDIMSMLTDSLLETNAFFWSDMLPTKTPSVSNTYSFKTNLPISLFPLSQVYDYTQSNYNGIVVYLSRTTETQGTVVSQLIRNVDYVISSSSALLEIVTDLLPNDTIIINEYHQTYGSFVPSTPTKMGMYPAFIPEIVLDDTYVTPTYFIRGHDGSMTKLYGTVDNGLLTDLRDRLLLEYELRVYNNLKVIINPPINMDEVVPGYSRTVGYTNDQYQSLYSTMFLSWAGLNRVTFTEQYYSAYNEYTWNYAGSTLQLNNQPIAQGNWRGIYLWLYDTAYPHIRPWEMLGLMIKPSWWDSYYGPAPYTSDNLVMWTDISNGFVYNDGNSFINQNRVRPDLLSMIPVDDQGNLLSPFEFLLGSYTFEKFNTQWQVGDMGPAEYAYRTSSTWPFDLMKLMAQMKPVQFFTYNVDLDAFQYNQEFNQYLIYYRTRTTNSTQHNFYGTDDTSSQHSYVAWIVDYQRQFGLNGTDEIVNLFVNSDVRLSYRMAGFSDKSQLRFFLEMTSSTNDSNSLLIPDESYQVVLYNNQATQMVSYSSLIIQVTENGYKVYGNKQIETYFEACDSMAGIYDTIALNNASVQIPRNYFDTTSIYPYGTEFKTTADLLTFVRGYGIYLTNLGFQFTSVENGTALTWNQMLFEILYWVDTAWTVGSTININPSATQLVFDDGNSVVQPLTLQKENFVLNQNLLPISLNDLTIERVDTNLTIKTLNQGDSISLFNASVSTIEHVIVFDNTTLFGDLIYNPVTGLRQQRIMLKGVKTAGWTGKLDAAGFIVSQDSITDWAANTKYVKGSVVNYKNQYWMANSDIVQPSATFDQTYWDLTSYEMVQQNMLPNPSTKSVESIKFYNTQQANLSNDADLLSFSLIGYRPRTYLSNADLDDPTQVNLYKSMIETKGTNVAADGLNGIVLNNNNLSYSVHENWAIKNSEYSGLNNQNFIEFTLDGSQLTGNPSIVSVVGDTNVDGSQQQIPLNQIKNYARNISSDSILSTLSEAGIVTNMPSAGYVNVDDVVEMGFNLNSLPAPGIYAVYRGDFVWLASINGSWDVFTPVPTNVSITSVINNLNGSITVGFSGQHNLLPNQVIGILNFDTRIDGYYVVQTTPTVTTITLNNTSLLNNSTIINGSGSVFLMQSQRVTTARDIVSLPVINTEFDVNLSWVDENQNGDWTVYAKQPKYEYNLLPKDQFTNNFGTAVANVPNLGYVVGDAGAGTVYIYRDSVNGDGTFFLHYQLSYLGTTFGQVMAYSDELLVISAPDSTYTESTIYIYRIPSESNIKFPVLEQIIPIGGALGGSAMALSGDSSTLYFNLKDSENELLALYARDPDLEFSNLGFVLSKPTVLNDNKFVVTGNVLSEITQGQRVSFVTAYNYVGNLAVNAALNATSFELEGDVTTTVLAGYQISFSNSGTAGDQLYTVLFTSYDPDTTYTTVFVEEAIAATVYNGTQTYIVTFDQDLIYTVVTGIYDNVSNETTFYLVETIQNIAQAGAAVYHSHINFQFIGTSAPPVWTYGDNFGASIATNYDGSKVFIGSPNASFTTTDGLHNISNVGRVWIADQLVERYDLKFTQDPFNPYYAFTVPWVPSANSVIYWNGVVLPSTKYIVFPGNVETNVATVIWIGPVGFKTGDILTFKSYNLVYSQFLMKSTTFSDLRTGEQFGSSISCNTWGSEVMVGAPNGVVDNNQEGCVIRFTNEGKKFGSISALIAATVVDPTYIYVNGFRVNMFLTLNPTTGLATGDTSITLNPSDASLLPATGVITIQNPSAGNFTMEYASVNATTGVVTFAETFATTSINWLASDIQVIAPPGSANNVAYIINHSGVPNVFAESDVEDRLIIKLIDPTLGPVDNKLNIMAQNGNIITQMGIGMYTESQTITNPHPQHYSHFGAVVKFNEGTSIVVGAPVANRYLKTVFDYDQTVDRHLNTAFDSNLTEFVDSFEGAGAAYMFDYIPCYNESLTNISNFVYAQPCNDVTHNYGFMPMYGSAIDYRNNMVMIGSPDISPSGSTTGVGSVVMYRNTIGGNDWFAFRYPDSVVDISKVKKAQLYDNTTNKTLLSLDYIDPIQGKLLGAVAQNVDYIMSIDPAGYNSSGKFKGKSIWNKDQVGKIWFDTSTARFVDYHQNDVIYDSKYWGAVFPGTSVDVYTWVESTNPPVTYTDTTGTPYDKTKYAVTFVTDTNSNLIPMYYYWVKNTNTLYSLQGKTLADSVVAQYIANPASSGVPFMAPIRTNTFALYNAQEYINGVSTNLHIGYSTSTSNSPAHVDYKLIRTNYEDDFLSGFPDPLRGISSPSGMYEKMIDSFAGSDSFGAVVPDPNLPTMLQIGTSIRPRQSMFVNRLTALENFIEFTNAILINYPASEITDLSLLSANDGATFDTRNYWSTTYWWATGYSNTTKTNMEVQRYADLLTLQSPSNGMIVGVAKNGNGKREVYAYLSNVWTRVGLQDGTFQFLSSLYDYANNGIGFGNDFFDATSYDAHPTIESRYIIRAINEQIFVGDLYQYLNQGLILMFEYIQSENVSTNGYLPWLNKTSFIDVVYNVRQLSQDTKYRPDNLDLLSGYVNEIKPYHVVIKEFLMEYSATDVVSGTVTDFDLPTFFNPAINRFVSPQLSFAGSSNVLEYSYTDPLWNSTPELNNWFNNFGLSLVDSPETVIGFVYQYLRASDTQMTLDNARGIPYAGILQVDDELISYSSVDREKGILYGLNRGINGTQPTFHIPGVQVIMDLPAITVLNPGRGYNFVPNVSASVDQSLPQPTQGAGLTPIMSGDKVVGIEISNPGTGFVVLPQIIIDPSITTTFTHNAINNSGYIVLNTTEFLTGDLVVSTGVGDNGITMIPNGNYYINVAEHNGVAIISFYNNYADSLIKLNPLTFADINTLSSDYTHTIGVTAHAVVYANNTLVRGISTTLKFDRTSYRSLVQPWSPNQYWSSTYHNASASINSTATLGYSSTYVNMTGTTSPLGGTGAVFTVTNWLVAKQYGVALTSHGSGYSAGDLITIAGTNLQGSSANNCVVKVDTVDGSGAILTYEIDTSSGVPAIVETTSIQGAVMPILGLSDLQGSAVITVDFTYSGIQPGQVNGTHMYFYRLQSDYVFTDTGGAVFNIYRPRFTIDGVVNSYFIKLVSGGTGYSPGQTLRVVGSHLGGSTWTNDAIITITATNSDTSIYLATVSGTPVIDFGQYYVKTISDTQLGIYSDPTLKVPVPYAAFMWNGATSYSTHGYGYPGTDYAYLPEPLTNNLSAQYSTASIVSYANSLWLCTQSNHDAVFDVNKWTPISQSDISLNALDRIEGFYQPTYDLPAKDIQQLLKGVVYPNTTYYGNSFSPEDVLPLDSYLTDRPFYPIDPNIMAMTYDGTQYLAAVDTPTKSVLLKSSDSIAWYSTPLSDTPLGVTGIAYNNGVYAITTTNPTTNLLISYDTGNWMAFGKAENFDDLHFDIGEYDTVSITAPSVPLNQVKYLNGAFYAVGQQILASTDGLTWNTEFQFYSRLLNNLYDIDYVTIPGYTGFISVGIGSQIISGANTAAPIVNPMTRIVTSLDGVNWNTQTTSLSSYALSSVTHSPTLIVVVGYNATTYYSVNGANWAQGTISGSSITANINSVTYGNGIFVAVGDKIGTNSSDPGLILKSTDGIHWSQESSSSISTENLHNVMFDGNFFYISGDNDTILRSVDGAAWVSQSNMIAEDPTYVVKGNDFLFGYGPEELVPGIVVDAISMQVNTAPGAYWNMDTSESNWFYNTNFSMVKFTASPDNYNKVNFAGKAINPLSLSVFYYDPDLDGYTRIYEATLTDLNDPYTYHVDWYNQVITLNRSLNTNDTLMVELYEMGNAVELARGNTDTTPIQTDQLTGNSMIVLDQVFQTLPVDPYIVSQTTVNGVTLLANNIDYTISPDINGTGNPLMKIQFNTIIDPTVTRIVYSIIGDSTTPTNITQYNYAFPQTETFVGNDGTDYTLTLSTDGTNAENGIVELDGVRLIPGVDYTITGSDLSLSNSIDNSRLLAFTTFNDTTRLYLSTYAHQSTTSGSVTITVPSPTVPAGMPTYMYSDVNTTWVTVNGRRMPTSRYSWGASNQLTITGVSNGDNILVTAMSSGASPNPTGFKLIVDKSNNPSVYRTNPEDRTWLVQSFGDTDQIMYVNDVSDLVEVVTLTNTPSLFTANNLAGFVVDFALSTVTYMTAFNITRGRPIDTSTIQVAQFAAGQGLAFTHGVADTDLVEITLYIGNVIETNGERMQFTTLDPVANTISGITRTIQTTVSTVHSQYDFVYGLSNARKLDSSYYSVLWNSSNYTQLGDPMQISQTGAAEFLNSDNS